MHMKFRYSDELPISNHRSEIIEAIVDNQVVIVVGETGSGKSTQIPKMILEALAEADQTDPEFAGFKIACTQPRRIAATSIAEWIATDMEVKLGEQVGYKIRFDDESSKGTLITICTDGILLQEMKGDNLMSEYDAVLVDEAHERNLNIDFLLGLLKDIQYRRVEKGLKPLKILVTSATVDAEKFANFFAELNGAKQIPVINVTGRTYPVEITYEDVGTRDNMFRQVASIVQGIAKGKKPGDVLIFMPGEAEIFSTIRAIDYLRLKGLKCLPLYSRLTMDEQHQIFQEYDGIKVVVATNIAETSLTVPGIHYVIDSGHAKMTDFDFRTGIGSLETRKISKASAVQRAGRAGRIAPGTCIRLYSEEDFEARIDYTVPEIQRSDLSSIVLHMILIGINDVEHFNFIDKPDMAAFHNAFQVLHDLGALDEHNNLTDLGHKMAHLPLEPRISAMLLAAEKYDCVKQIAIIASSLSVKDFFLRPKDEEDEADAAKRYFQKMSGQIRRGYRVMKVRKGRRMIRKKVYDKEDSSQANYVSDLVTLLHVWNKVKAIPSQEQREEYCESNYLNFQILEEIEQIYFQLLDTLKTFAGGEFEKYIVDEDDLVVDVDRTQDILKAILSGLIHNICELNGTVSYRSGKSDEIYIHPGSALIYLKPRWFVSAEIVETTRLYARNNSIINVAWLEEIAPFLCNRKVGNLYFDEETRRVTRDEDVFFKNHRIVKKRKVELSDKDRYLAFEFFVREGLVRRGMIRDFEFIDQNDKVRKELETIVAITGDEKYLLDQKRMFDWYVVQFSDLKKQPISKKELQSLIEEKGDDFLRVSLDNFLSKQERDKLKKDYPTEVYIKGEIHEVKYYAGHYHFPDGPVISLNVSELQDLCSQDVQSLLKTKPYFLVCNGEPFISPTAEGYDIDEIKEEYDLWYQRKVWKQKKKEMEARGIRQDSVYEHFGRVLEEVDIGDSLFYKGKRIFGYIGLKREGRKFILTLFDSKQRAFDALNNVLKYMVKQLLKYKFDFDALEKDMEGDFWLDHGLDLKIDQLERLRDGAGLKKLVSAISDRIISK